ncbi:ABC transporter ATP-binding protein [Kineosporia sp. A_224]|uniref:ABC transporter ATP-binding protein n=1 Tax=Kineosporia sp. A_224 TaxID=1962180 RepID=UPI001E425567|nr:ABC transporter ATP-binding protein [Kineosporia sp. A_224]
MTVTENEARPASGAAPEPVAHGGVRLTGVTKVFGRGATATTAVQDVDLDVRPGEFVTIVGASGCGKSTLLSLVAGLEQVTTGTLEVGGRVALMFQEATLLPWLTAAQNVALALKLRGVARAERTPQAHALLERVRLGAYADKRPHELSGGMRQRVALARVLAQDASVVCMDEPLGALDAMTRDHMHDEIERVAGEAGLTVLFVTHNVREAVRLGDRAVLMGSSPGRVVHTEHIDLPRPRRMEDPEVARRAGSLTAALREDVARHVG